MPKDSVDGHSLGLPSALQVFDRVAQRPTATPHHQRAASSGSAELEVNGKEFNLRSTKPKVHPCAAEILLRGQEMKLKEKATPYISKSGFLGVKLNGWVQVKPSELAVLEPESVVCRHLATLFCEHAEKKSELMQALSTRQGIAEKFDGKLIATHCAYLKAVRETPAGCKHLVNSEQLGAYLQAMATQLQAPGSAKSTKGPSQANCLLGTADHAMALHVERKIKNGVEYFSAKLYDPNDTAIYRRVVKASPENFGNLKLKDMMISPQLINEYGGGEDKPLSMVALSLDHRLQPPMDRSATTPSAENMHIAMQFGVLEEICSMLKFALEGQQAPSKHIELLRANSLQDALTVSGLYVAFQDGQSDAVQAFTEAVLASNLLQEDKVSLLAEKRSDGYPGLYAALQYGQSDAVKVFCKAVFASDLNSPHKVGLLATCDSHGVPGLLMALQEGHTAAVKAFSEAVLASDLKPQDKIGLLAAKCSNGVPGLFIAFQEGHFAAVNAFSEAVLATNLSQEAKVDLLAAKRPDGVPGLFIALQHGRCDTVKVFAQEVLASNLSEQAMVGLLAAKTSDGVLGLHVALEGGHSDAVKAFDDKVLASNLSQEAKDNLLTGFGDFSCLSFLIDLVKVVLRIPRR